MTVIENVKNLKTITTLELHGSLITHEYTLKRDRKEQEVDNRKIKDLALQLLMGSMDGPNQAFYSRKFKNFMNKKVLDKRGDKKRRNPNLINVKFSDK